MDNGKRNGRNILLDESILGYQVEKGLLGDIVIMDAILLTRPGASCSVRDGESKGIGVTFEEEVVESALTDPRGTGNDNGPTVGREVGSFRDVSRTLVCWFVGFEMT